MPKTISWRSISSMYWRLFALFGVTTFFPNVRWRPGSNIPRGDSWGRSVATRIRLLTSSLESARPRRVVIFFDDFYGLFHGMVIALDGQARVAEMRADMKQILEETHVFIQRAK